MLLCRPNPVDCFGISHDLSTSGTTLKKLFNFSMVQSVGLQTMFNSQEVVEITVENSLVHRR
jgi:hypothetical protein